MQYSLTLSLLFATCSLFSADNNQYIAHPPSVRFGGTILPCTLINSEPYFLLGKESYPENGLSVWSDFGGSNEPLDISAQQVALRELAEETAKTFCDDALFDPRQTTKPQVIANIKQYAKELRVHPYINGTLGNNKKMLYWSVAKVPYKLPSELRANVRNAQQEKYQEMADFMWVKAYPFLETILKTRADNDPQSTAFLPTTILVTNDLGQYQKIAIRALFFRRIRPAENNAKIRNIITQYVQNPY